MSEILWIWSEASAGKYVTDFMDTTDNFYASYVELSFVCDSARQ